MSDLISRSALLEALEKEIFSAEVYNNDFDRTVISNLLCLGSVKEIAEELPTIDAVPVVHCKDCVHWGTGVAGETEHVKCCEYGKYMVGENGYCCYADMRGGKND